MHLNHNIKRDTRLLLEIDSRLDKGDGLPNDLPNHAKTFHDIGGIDRKISVDLAQKAKVKWAVEGTRILSSFTVLLPRKDVWEPSKTFICLGVDSSHDLEGDISNDEIKKASTFIKARQILDGTLILNEIVSWCKSRKEQALLFKVDFQKALDSLRWDHLDDILGKFGFGSKWRGWIRGCLHSSKASVLVNGSPTDKF
nr:cysteine-rich receptor-like protein kinase [Tanacetum cinerariifolium]